MKGTLSTIGLATLAISLACTQAAEAFVLSNGSLSVTIREDNGAIGEVLFGGSDFYNPGTPISDHVIQEGINTSTFVSFSNVFGSGSAVVSGDSEKVTTTASTPFGINFTRVYSLVPGLNVLRTITTFTNGTTNTNLTVSFADTFDPDQGIDKGGDFSTSNDVKTLNTAAGVAKVAQATEAGGLTVVMGSVNPNATVAAGFPFWISNGFELNNFFANPFDADGAFRDSGIHVGISSLLAAGESFSFTFDQAYGLTALDADQAFIAANADDSSTPIPTPALLPGLIGMGVAALRKRGQEEGESAEA